MASMTPSRGPTETLTVNLAAIRQDPSWPVDSDLVASFRASIRRGEPPLLDLSLNRIRPNSVRRAQDASGSGVQEASDVLEIIDGMHRLEALRQEGVTTHSAKVREYSPQDAFYARIATSLGKPNDLFRQRAEQALREGFVRDVAAHIEGAIIYQHGMTEEGMRQPTPRREPLPADPLLALGTILWVHFAAKPNVTEDWERFVLDWLEEIARRLGKSTAWLRDDVLRISALVGGDLPGAPSAERARLLLAIPDDGIMRLALARLKTEPKLSTTDLRFALDILGCGPDVGRHAWLKPRRLPEMRSMLAHASLSQLARDYTNALARAEAASRLVRPLAPVQLPPALPPAQPPQAATPATPSTPAGSATPAAAHPTPLSAPPANAPAPETPPVNAPQPATPASRAPQETGAQPPSVTVDVGVPSVAADHPTVEHPVLPPDSSAVFGVVSARFGNTDTRAPRGTIPAPGTPPATSPVSGTTGMPTDDLFLPAHRLADALVSAWHAFDQRGGDWSRPDIRQELTHLRTLIDGYLSRGASTALLAPTE